MPTNNQQTPCQDAARQTQRAWAIRESIEGRTPVLPLLPSAPVLCPVCNEHEAEHDEEQQRFCLKAMRWPLNCPHCGTGYKGRHTGFCPLKEEDNGL